MNGTGKAKKRRSKTKWKKGVNRRNSQDSSSSDSSELSPRRDNLQDRSKKQRDQKRALQRRKDRINRMRETIEFGERKSSSLNYNYSVNTKSRIDSNEGIEISSSLYKKKKSRREGAKDPVKTLRINNIRVDKSGSLNSAINAIESTGSIDKTGRMEKIGKVEINLNGVADKTSLQKELNTIDEKINVGFIYKNNEGRTKELEEGFEGITKLMDSVSSKFKDSDMVREISDLIALANEKQPKYLQSIESINNVLDTHNKIKESISNLENELRGSDGSELVNGLKIAVAFETERELERLSLEKNKFRELNDAIVNNFENSIPDQMSSENRVTILSLSDKFLKLAKAARLNPDDINSFFKEYTVITMVGDKVMGGELAKLIQKEILNNQEEGDINLQDLEDKFRDVMGLGLARLKKRIQLDDKPSNIFNRDKLTFEDGSIEQVVKIQENEEGRLARLRKKFRNRNAKKIQGDLQAIDTSTASDVYSVKTQGIIGTSGTNEGFAKKALKEGDQSNEGTDKLKFPTNTREYGGKFGEKPNLIARQVVSSRLDAFFRLDVLATEIFSKDNSNNIVGISAKVPGSAIKTVNEEMKLMHRNFDFSNPVTQKSLSNLQLLDALTGQLDRHGGNIFIDPKTGQAYGIDNDVAFPPTENFDDSTALKKQFTRREDGKLIFNQEQIDFFTAKRFLTIGKDAVEGILRGYSKDPENLDDASITLALERFVAIQEKIKTLGSTGKLIIDWTDETYGNSTNESDLTNDERGVPEYTNYVQRSVGEFKDAALPENTSSFQGL